MKKILVLVALLFLITASSVMAQDVCEGNFDCDQDVDGSDAAVFKDDFGRSAFSDPCETCIDSSCPCTPAPVPKTGQTTCYDNSGLVINCITTGQDGEHQKGVAWPAPRFTDNGDGTVTDNLTGLIWLKNANCFQQRNWSDALSDCNGLADGSCGLTDGSNAGDWRLPNRRELFSLVHDEYYNPAVPNTAGTDKWSEGDPFNSVQSGYYWSSTTIADCTLYAWDLSMYNGHVYSNFKPDNDYVWPVRGGQQNED